MHGSINFFKYENMAEIAQDPDFEKALDAVR